MSKKSKRIALLVRIHPPGESFSHHHLLILNPPRLLAVSSTCVVLLLLLLLIVSQEECWQFLLDSSLGVDGGVP